MLEILFIVLLYKQLRRKVEAKNLSRGLPWMAPFFWFAGQFTGAFFAAVIFALRGIPVEGNLALYGFALLGGILGALFAFLIVKLLPYNPLHCPACETEVTNRSVFGFQCAQCETELKIVNNKVSVLNA